MLWPCKVSRKGLRCRHQHLGSQQAASISTSVCCCGILRCVQDDRTIGSEEAVYMESLKKDLEGVLAGLSARDAGVLRMRFGLLDGREYTLDEVGAEFKVGV